MIKKLIGIVVAVAVIVVIVIAALHRDDFQSMVLRNDTDTRTLPAPAAPQPRATPAPGETEAADSLSGTTADSLREAGVPVG